MFGWKPSQILPIGLDVGADSVKMLQLQILDDSLSVFAAAKLPLPAEARKLPDARLAAALKLVGETLDGGTFKGRRIVTALPREIVRVKNLRLPVMPPEEIDAAVQFEARAALGLESADAVVAHIPAGEVRQGADSRLEIMAVGALQQDVDTYTEQLHRSGCIVDSLDFEPGALYRSIERFMRRRDDDNEVNVLLEIGARRSQIVIGKGREITFYKPLETGAAALNDAVARKLRISVDEARALRRRLDESREQGDAADTVRQAVHDALRTAVEQLAGEITLCLRYYSVTFRGQRPTRMRVLGGESCDANLIALLAASVSIAVEIGQPLLSVDCAKMPAALNHGNLGEWAVALGLGLKRTHQYFGARDGRKRADVDAERLATPRIEIDDVAMEGAVNA